jgi:hypothetical protein
VSGEDEVANVLLSELFVPETEEASAKKVSLSTLQKRFAEGAYAIIVEGLHEEVLAKGYFVDNPKRARMVRVLGGGLVTLVCSAGAFLLEHSTLIAVGVAGALSGILVSVAGAVLPARTAKGATLLRELEEYRRTLLSPESSLFEDGDTEAFSRTLCTHLAYGIAFSLEGEWAERFAEQDMVYPDWFAVKEKTQTAGVFLSQMTHVLNAFTAFSAISHTDPLDKDALTEVL